MNTVPKHSVAMDYQKSPRSNLDKDYLLVEQFESSLIPELLSLEEVSHGSPWSEKLLDSEFSNELSRRLALKSKISGRLIGYIFNQLIEDELHILNIVVDPILRGEGLGRFLLNESIRRSLDEGVKSALLEVRPSNVAALALYRSMGFKVTAKRKRYYRDNGEDALMLMLSL